MVLTARRLRTEPLPLAGRGWGIQADSLSDNFHHAIDVAEHGANVINASGNFADFNVQSGNSSTFPFMT
jgi:hypothetical protein